MCESVFYSLYTTYKKIPLHLQSSRTTIPQRKKQKIRRQRQRRKRRRRRRISGKKEVNMAETSSAAANKWSFRTFSKSSPATAGSDPSGLHHHRKHSLKGFVSLVQFCNRIKKVPCGCILFPSSSILFFSLFFSSFPF